MPLPQNLRKLPIYMLTFTLKHINNLQNVFQCVKVLVIPFSIPLSQYSLTNDEMSHKGLVS